MAGIRTLILRLSTKEGLCIILLKFMKWSPLHPLAGGDPVKRFAVSPIIMRTAILSGLATIMTLVTG